MCCMSISQLQAESSQVFAAASMHTVALYWPSAIQERTQNLQSYQLADAAHKLQEELQCCIIDVVIHLVK